MTASALPYVAGAVIAAWWIAGETWLQRRTGQSWWTIDQLVWGLISVGVAVLVAIAGHPLPALAVGSVAIWQLRSARRTWMARGEAERYRSPRTGVRGWLFIVSVVAIWTLLEHAGLSYVSAGLVAGLIGVTLFLPLRRSTPDSTPTVERFPPEPPQGHGFEIRLSGRPARLAARLFDRAARPPTDARDDEKWS